MTPTERNEGRVVVIDTGLANLASMLAGLRRVGLDPIPSDDPAVVSEASGLVLPGVGRYDAGMAAWTDLALVDPIRSFIESGRPVLAICLGMQLLGCDSEESPGVAGLAVVEASVRRLPPGRVRPHLGWNLVTPDRGLDPMLVPESGAAHFAHGFAFRTAPPGWNAAWCEDGGRFVAALQRDAIVACQFHPEVSGRFGTRLLSGWAGLVRREVASCCCPA